MSRRTGSAASRRRCSSTCSAASGAPVTSVLSHRWRGLWTELRELSFRDVGSGALEHALPHIRPKVKRLDIAIKFRKDSNPSGARISSLLRAADRLAPAELDVSLYQDYSQIPVTFELPSFSSATSLNLFVSRVNFTLAPAGDFSLLEQLYLCLHHFTIDLSGLLPRCPRLQKLRMYLWARRPIDTIVVKSKCLKDVEFDLTINGPGRVVIVAPELKKLILVSRVHHEFTVSAPKMEELRLHYTCEHSCVGFGNMWRMWSLGIEKESSHRNGSPPIPVQILSLIITDFNCRTAMERNFAKEIARLPVNNFSVLKLSIQTLGHVYGQPALDLLRICTSMRKLELVLTLVRILLTREL